MADLPSLLRASLSPSSRKQAEQSLNAQSTQPGFLGRLLALCLDHTQQERAVRLAGSVFLKNVAKTRWDEDVAPLPAQDKVALKGQLIPAMIQLSGPADKAIRAQIAETVSLIAAIDFPENWSDLVDTLVTSLSHTDYSTNIALLETAHSIFRPWRAAVRSDALFTVINFVLARFVDPFLALFQLTARALLDGSGAGTGGALLAQAQVALVEIFYDLTCQDLPPAIEDAYDEFFSPPEGLFQRFLAWNPVELRVDPEETVPSLPSQIKAGVLEIAELYVKLYPDQLSKSPSVESFVQGVWSLVGSGKLTSAADDAVVSQAMRFISSAIRSGHYKQLFGSKEVIVGLIQGVVVPNVGLREHEIEQFEDDPLEFIRRDLSLSSGLSGGGASDGATRRQAAADVLQALVGSGHEADATDAAGAWVTAGLREYAADPAGQWAAKDSAVYLLTAVATRGATVQHGVTSTNALVDVVDFFSKHVYQDLEAAPGTVHPILQVDAIRFLYTFRNQLTKAQLLSVLPLLIRHLGADNYVTYTYAAITIERVLFIKQGPQLLFSQADIHDAAPALLDALLAKIESAGSPEKMAENDHLMKCAMRVIMTARQTLTPGYERTLARLVAILGVISKNPSNPNFDQYIFESMSALIRFVVSGSPATLATFEGVLFGPFTIILQQDIDQYIPYIFQILGQMLELHAEGAPVEYRALLPFLLNPASWQQKGSIPGLVKLLKAFLARDRAQMAGAGQFVPVLGVVQQRLVPSKMNDAWGFELLQAVVQNIPPETLRPYFRSVIVTLLTRMQSSKTDKYAYLFTYFLLFTMAIPVEGLSSDYVIGAVEEIQPRLWSQILANFVVPEVPKMPPKDRKVVAVGMTRMLTESAHMLQEPSVAQWPAALTALVKLFQEPQYLTSKPSSAGDDAGSLTAIDYEEASAGYQAAYSRLVASEGAPADPVPQVRDPREFLGQRLAELGKKDGRVRALVGAAEQDVVSPFVQGMAAAGMGL